MSKSRIIDIGSKKIDLNDNDLPVALIYFGRFVVRDWEELFLAAVKCLYMEFPDVISNLCSTDPTRNLFLRTTTIDMERPQRIAPIIFLETKRTPLQIVKALRTIFRCAGVLNINMQIEVVAPSEPKISDLEKIFSPPILPEKNREEKILLPADFKKISPPVKKEIPQKSSGKLKLPVFSLDQSIEEMLAALDAVSPVEEKKSPPPPKKIPAKKIPTRDELEVPLLGNLFFVVDGECRGPFANEKIRYVELMKYLADAFPEKMVKSAGRHVNSQHRVTLVRGGSYLYFREPVMLPNDLFADKGFSDKILMENARYYLEICGLNFDSVMLTKKD